ncbi:MAG: acetylxylan esterase [Candidatus Spyradocola sp.]
MPIVDMPVKELETYLGSSPKPADFDAYWDKALADLDAQDLNVEFVPAAFQTPNAECFDLFFTGVGGSRIHARFVKPRNVEGKCPAILQFHGYTGSAGDWSAKLNYVNEGFVVAALDCRGQGGISEDLASVRGTTYHGMIIRGLDDPDPEKLHYRNVYLDTVALARIVMGLDYVDETRVGAMGGSQGGGLTMACIGLEPRINRAAPVYPFLSDYKRVWDMDLDQRAYEELRSFFRHHDPRHEREDAIFEKLGYIDVANLAPRVKSIVKMATGLLDDVCPPSTQYAAYNRLTCEKTHVLSPDFGHEYLPDFDDITFQFMLEMKK